jgi:hypothetical protein
MDGGATVAVLLVVEVQRDTIGKQEFWQWGIMSNELSISPKADVLTSKLYRSCSPIFVWHCIFANAQQKIESCCDEITSGSC